MSTVPVEIRQGGPATLVIRWADDIEHAYDVFDLRCHCPCASCVDELTGARLLDRASVPRDIRPRNIVSVGNYALKFQWSDGHDTGLYSFRLLRDLAELLRGGA